MQYKMITVQIITMLLIFVKSNSEIYISFCSQSNINLTIFINLLDALLHYFCTSDPLKTIWTFSKIEIFILFKFQFWKSSIFKRLIYWITRYDITEKHVILNIHLLHFKDLLKVLLHFWESTSIQHFFIIE